MHVVYSRLNATAQPNRPVRGRHAFVEKVLLRATAAATAAATNGVHILALDRRFTGGCCYCGSGGSGGGHFMAAGASLL